MVFDVAIIGAGCAGMSLAGRLARPGGLQCVILEAGQEFATDRTWCFWDLDELAGWGLTEDAAWAEWALRIDGREIVHRSPHRYVCITPRRFFATQVARIERGTNVQIRMGSPVHTVRREGASFRLDGRWGEIRARRVFDTRPVRPPAGAMLQHFAGWEIETRPVFEPRRAMLMDFDVDQSQGIHFMYVLPFSRTRALVEATVLSPEPWPAERYDMAISRYIEARFGLRSSEVEVQRRERGVLPMSRGLRGNSRDSTALGSAAGAAKTSTGYAFPFIQRQADQIAAALLSDRDAVAHLPRPRLLSWLDSVFVSVLRRDPARAPVLFRRLFEATSGRQFARFMMERPAAADVLGIVRAMPPGLFLRAALADLLP